MVPPAPHRDTDRGHRTNAGGPAWLCTGLVLQQKNLMRLSPSKKMLGDTKLSPEDAGVAPRYPRGPCIPALHRT